jgi:hypothetical protein
MKFTLAILAFVASAIAAPIAAPDAAPEANLRYVFVPPACGFLVNEAQLTCS